MLLAASPLFLPQGTAEWFEATRQIFQASVIGLTPELAAGAYLLPGAFHPDRAARLLVATARQENPVLVTVGRRILAYPHVATRDAGEKSGAIKAEGGMKC